MEILSLKQFNEKMKANQISLSDLKDVDVYSCHPKTTDELRQIIEDRIMNEGPECNLNDIDVSNITDMRWLFYESKFNGDISKWNVSNVKYMSYMFNKSKFNGDISKWDVSGVLDMKSMFRNSKFNGDVSKWNVSSVKEMSFMFAISKFNGDISQWKVSGETNMIDMVFDCPLENNPPAWYKNE